MLTEKFSIVSLLGPTADYNGSALVSDAVNLKNYDKLTILVAHKGGTTGKSTLTLTASSDASQTGATAIPFRYRRKTTGASSVWSAVSAATSAGIDTVPAEDTLIEMEVRSSELPDGKTFVNVAGAEGVNDPVVGCIIAILSTARFQGATLPDSLS